MSSAQPHTAKAAYFTCIDDRLPQAIAAFIGTLNGGAFHGAMAGGGVAFLQDDTKAAALKQVTVAYTINQITDVYLESHTNCGAYGLAGIVFDSPQDELDRLASDLQRAADLVRQALVGAGADSDALTIHMRIVDPTGQLLQDTTA